MYKRGGLLNLGLQDKEGEGRRGSGKGEEGSPSSKKPSKKEQRLATKEWKRGRGGTDQHEPLF